MTQTLAPFLEMRSVGKKYTWKGKILAALQGITLEIKRGETLGIVGESGSGKSTLGRIAACHELPSSGTLLINGIPAAALGRKEKFRLRRQVQLIFQDPYSSLNPLLTIGQSIAEGIAIHGLAYGAERRALIASVLNAVGLPSEAMDRYPHEFSGGQRQRIVIARALAVGPEFLVCDEPLASLDMCTQKQVMELFKQLKRDRGLTMLFISHDISAVGAISDKVAVMYLGTIVEYGAAKDVIGSPKHPYTKALIGALPIPDPAAEKARQKILLPGEPPSPLSPPKGCPFHPRCSHASDLCRAERPVLAVSEGRALACHHRCN